MKKIIFSFFTFLFSITLHAQYDYDSVTISRFVVRDSTYGPGWDRITHAGSAADLVDERTIWKKPRKPQKNIPSIFVLTRQMEENGMGAISRCFIPRHSINYYKSGIIVRYMLVCFECEEIKFTDIKGEERKKLISREERLRQIDELRVLFKDLDPDAE